MNKITLFAVLVLTLLMGSCSSDSKSRVAEILEGVPADAEAVIVLRPEVASQFDNADLKTLTNPDCGVDTAAVAVFYHKGYLFATGLLTDAGQFKGQSASGFQSIGKAEVSDRVMVADGRYWIALQRSPADEIYTSLASLKESQSMASTPFADALEADSPLTARLSSELLFGETSDPKVRMLIAMMFDDANSLVLNGKFAGNKLTADGYIATSKGEHAKFLLPTGTIDPFIAGQLKGAGAETVILLGAPNKMVRKLVALLAGADGGMMAGMGPGMLNLLNAIDGTIAAAISPQDSQIIATLNTDDQKIKTSAASLATALSVVYGMPVTAGVGNNMLMLTSGAPEGKPALLGSLPDVSRWSLALATRVAGGAEIANLANVVNPEDGMTVVLTAQFLDRNSFALTIEGANPCLLFKTQLVTDNL